MLVLQACMTKYSLAFRQLSIESDSNTIKSVGHYY